MTREAIKRHIKSAFELLPFDLGRNIAIPVSKWFLAVFIYNRPIKDYRRKTTMRRMAQEVDDFIRVGNKQATIVYDNFVSPPTYGDYLYVILIARYLIYHGIKVNYIIVDSDFRKDWSCLTEAENENFVSEQVRLANALLDPALTNIERLSWHALQQRIACNTDNSLQCIQFMDYTVVRKPIYNYCFNLLNQLLHDKDRSLINSVLFSLEALSPNVDFVRVNGKYITWVCRYSRQWAIERNLSENEFLSIYDRLRNSFPHHQVMVVSDEAGCDYFSELGIKHKLHLIFSKEYSKSFLGDAALILNSDYLFQLRGGGIGTIPMFSVLPYEIICPLANEMMWSKSKVLSFQLDSQLFFNRMS